MSEQIIKRYEELIAIGLQLVPLGGFDFSGYNARLQNKYLEWRKSCLELLELTGPLGFPYKQKVLGDSNGGFFFQSSAQLILNCIKELYEKLKSSPELAVTSHISATVTPTANNVTIQESSGARILKPPPKPAQSQTAPNVTAQVQQAQISTPSQQSNKVYVIGENDDPLRAQLSQFLNEIGLVEVGIERQHGQMLQIDALKMDENIKYAFFIISSDDLTYAMFEIGHFVGKLGNNRVCVLHMSDVNFPKNVPSVLVKSIVVKLEEASLGIIKELKAIGYQISL